MNKSIEIENELNVRLNQRNIPTQNLKPNFDFRPQPTKYTDFQMIDRWVAIFF